MRPILITIAGGTASGKSTVVREIIKHFSKEEVRVICQDNYYKAQDDLTMEERVKTNYDHPESFDTDLMHEQLAELLNGNSIDMPIYDFKVHNRSDEVKHINPSKVIILEGILALYDKRIRDISDILIYVESDPDIRFIRRLKRDIEERGRDMNGVIMQYIHHTLV